MSTPRSKSTANHIIKKQKAFAAMRMTTHWPHKVILFPTKPRTYGSPMPTVGDISKPVLSKLGLSLAGF